MSFLAESSDDLPRFLEAPKQPAPKFGSQAYFALKVSLVFSSVVEIGAGIKNTRR
jgi:hypothetical protein